ncbi:MAG: precorrin-4 C(11)-methyltransferase [Magnetococcales bacterium]|nr:precorrin-4 C(11)-methyltransferase [Magnetococcales bacterium]MBF0149846.1 precorrin-4 C(11)-methyltransferase [Magnetococcales bacterium]MBF0173662.1 precorrin-4 C(11)-methyltransferase [Magnetococcales bacterium]MBF0346584.1 precorrin-4 C(11)-methyltransferase [Magnetococcales bacterium]
MPTMGKLWIVGAGPGAVDLITVRGREVISRANAILYAGSLVSPQHLDFAPPGCETADSSSMTLDEMLQWLKERLGRLEHVVRLQTGDPSLYGALTELTTPLRRQGVEMEVIPGVSSAMASAAAAMESLTLPEVTQTVILTRTEGRTPMPEKEQLRHLAAHGATLCIFLSATLLEKVTRELYQAGWSQEQPVLVVHKATWPGEERIIRGRLADIAQSCREAGIGSQAMIITGPALNAAGRDDNPVSRLYADDFSHQFRTAG